MPDYHSGDNGEEKSPENSDEQNTLPPDFWVWAWFTISIAIGTLLALF